MIKGDKIENLTKDQLNTIYNPDFSNNKKFEAYMDYVYDFPSLYGSERMRKEIIELGYEIIELYPIYHQGWEMDFWGAKGTREGKKYDFTTNHGGLRIEQI